MSLSKVSLACLAGLGIAGFALADIERTCNGSGYVPERWPGIPAGGIPLALACGPGSAGAPFDTRPAPGFPNSGGSAISFGMAQACGILIDEVPIHQSLFRATETWNNAAVPGTTTPATSFRVNGSNPGRNATYPALAGPIPPYLTSTLLVNNNVNVVTLWEPPNTWVLRGTITIAVADADANSNGSLTNCDIAFNTTTSAASNPGVPLYRFVEDNAALGATVTTKSLTESSIPGGGFIAVEPIIAWVDLEGAMVHEFGHFAGLGHSLVEGSTNLSGSATPTMFAEAQATAFTGPVVLNFMGCTGNTQLPVNAAGTSAGGILGVPARDLAADDVASLVAGYGAASAAGLGGISGRVLNGSGGVRAAHVVAILASDPGNIRVGSFSIQGGTYQIAGLAPGDYYLMVEWPEANGFFANTQMPEIADPGVPPCGFPVSSPYPASFRTEFWNGTGESFNEMFPMAANLITVLPNAVTPVSDIGVEGQSGLVLRAATCTQAGASCGAASARGTVHRALGSANASVRLTLSGGNPSGLGIFALCADQAATPFSFSQNLLVNLNTTVMFTQVFSPTGSATLNLPVGPGNIGQTFYVQGAEFDANLNDFVLGNAVTLRLVDM